MSDPPGKKHTVNHSAPAAAHCFLSNVERVASRATDFSNGQQNTYAGFTQPIERPPPPPPPAQYILSTVERRATRATDFPSDPRLGLSPQPLSESRATEFPLPFYSTIRRARPRPPARPPPDHQDARWTCDMVVGSKERRVFKLRRRDGVTDHVSDNGAVSESRAASHRCDMHRHLSDFAPAHHVPPQCPGIAGYLVTAKKARRWHTKCPEMSSKVHTTYATYATCRDSCASTTLMASLTAFRTSLTTAAFETDNEEDDAPDDDDESSEAQLRRLDEQDFDMPAILDGHDERLCADPEEPYRIPEHLVQLSGAETPARGEDDYQSDIKMYSRPTSPRPFLDAAANVARCKPRHTCPRPPSAAQPAILPDPVTAPVSAPPTHALFLPGSRSVTPFAYHGPPLSRDSTPYPPFASSQTLFLPHSRGPTPFMDDSTSYPPSSSSRPMAPRSPSPAPDSPPPKRRRVDSPPGSPAAATSSTKRAVLQFFDTAAGDSDEDIPEEDEDDEETLSDAGISVTGFIDDDVPEDGLPNARPIFDDDSDDDLHEASDEKIQQLVARYEKEAGKYARDAKRERGHRSSGETVEPDEIVAYITGVVESGENATVLVGDWIRLTRAPNRGALAYVVTPQRVLVATAPQGPDHDGDKPAVNLDDEQAAEVVVFIQICRGGSTVPMQNRPNLVGPAKSRKSAAGRLSGIIRFPSRIF
ncbi:hypothetical protein B0H11DRAFT_1934436 [Mycena galericulata]|nr:hypothetical protein B0H11DRAFT_1934436 [Mycena galericulata]